METKKNLGKNTKFIIVIFLFLFCGFAVFSRAIPLPDIPAGVMGVLLGAIITAVITQLLLEQQAVAEELKERNVKIFEVKREVVQNYINTVWKVWEDQKITVKEFQKLTSQYYQNIMIYLKDTTRLETIGKELTKMGEKIDKNTYPEAQELRRSIVAIINELSKELHLGGQIDVDIMNAHDKILFPILFRKELLDELNKKLITTGLFKEGKYETIWEGAHHEFITFELKKYPVVKLAFGIIGAKKEKDDYSLKMVFMADRNIKKLNEFRKTMYSGSQANRLVDIKNLGGFSEIIISKPIPDETDKTETPILDFSNGEEMEKFRKEKRDFPDILAKRASYYLENGGIIPGVKGIEEINGFFDKYLSEKEGYDVK